jgi:peptidyl-prolyl cis-trans isomerase C
MNQIELNRQETLVNAFIADYVKNNPISDDLVKAEYDRARAQAGDKEYKVRHILVKDETEAKQIIAQLKKGGSFDKIAAQKSVDPGSKDKGGDLDWAPAGRYVPQFGDALKKLKKGQTTDAPVQTQFGFHVIRLDDERPMKFPPIEEVKPQIQQGLQRQQIEKLITDLRAKAKVE